MDNTPTSCNFFFILSKWFTEVCVFRTSKCSGYSWRSGSGGLELVYKTTLKHTTVWKDRMKSTKWILKNARWVKATTPCHQDFIRKISDRKVPLNVNLIPCFPLQCFPIHHYISSRTRKCIYHLSILILYHCFLHNFSFWASHWKLSLIHLQELNMNVKCRSHYLIAQVLHLSASKCSFCLINERGGNRLLIYRLDFAVWKIHGTWICDIFKDNYSSILIIVCTMCGWIAVFFCNPFIIIQT